MIKIINKYILYIYNVHTSYVQIRDVYILMMCWVNTWNTRAHARTNSSSHLSQSCARAWPKYGKISLILELSGWRSLTTSHQLFLFGIKGISGLDGSDMTLFPWYQQEYSPKSACILLYAISALIANIARTKWRRTKSFGTQSNFTL